MTEIRERKAIKEFVRQHAKILRVIRGATLQTPGERLVVLEGLAKALVVLLDTCELLTGEIRENTRIMRRQIQAIEQRIDQQRRVH